MCLEQFPVLQVQLDLDQVEPVGTGRRCVGPAGGKLTGEGLEVQLE